MRKVIFLFLFPVLISAAAASAQDNGIDPSAIIERIIAVEKKQSEAVQTVTFDAEYIEGEIKDEGFKEKVRFLKKVYIKYETDTALFNEEYLEYYKEGELQSQEKLEKEVNERDKKKKKRKAKDISYSMLAPFYEENSEFYDIVYRGTTTEIDENYTCHHFKVTAKEEEDKYINGDFYFDSESFNPVRVDFSPAKLTKKTMFKMKELKMTILYAAAENGFWFPSQFDVSGKGKAMFFIGVKFAGTEYYRNPVVNSPGVDEKFEVKDGE